MSTVTAFSHEVRDPAELPEVLERGLRRLSGPAGRGRCTSRSRSTSSAARRTARPGIRARPRARGRLARRRRASRPPPTRLASARSPLILLGGGARDAGRRPALALARRLGAPVGLTINARGAIDHDDPLCLGSALAFAPVSRHPARGGRRRARGRAAVGPRPVGPRCPARADRRHPDRRDAGQLERRYPPEGRAARRRASRRSRRSWPPRWRGGAWTGTPGGTARAERRVAEALASIEWPPAVADFADVVAALDAALPSRPPDRGRLHQAGLRGEPQPADARAQVLADADRLRLPRRRPANGDRREAGRAEAQWWRWPATEGSCSRSRSWRPRATSACRSP